MSIADAPLWAQTPTAEVRRDIAFSAINAGSKEPFSVALMWGELDPGEWESFIGMDVPDGISVDEARRLWLALGELLAVERLDPVPSQAAATIPVTLSNCGEPHRVLRTAPIQAGTDLYGDPLTVHVEVSGDPLPHGPEEMRPTLCINRVYDDDPDRAWIEIDDPDSLDRLIDALIVAGPVLRDQWKKAGL